MLRVLGLSLIAAAAMAGMASAGSANGIIRKDVTVNYRDLDLNSDTGARVMLARITMAAKEACGNSPIFYSSYNISSGWAEQEFAKCRADAIQHAVMSLKAPAVAKLYAMNVSAQAPRLASY